MALALETGAGCIAASQYTIFFKAIQAENERLHCYISLGKSRLHGNFDENSEPHGPESNLKKEPQPQALHGQHPFWQNSQTPPHKAPTPGFLFYPIVQNVTCPDRLCGTRVPPQWVQKVGRNMRCDVRSGRLGGSKTPLGNSQGPWRHIDQALGSCHGSSGVQRAESDRGIDEIAIVQLARVHILPCFQPHLLPLFQILLYPQKQG
jgi:hypothetical protein